MNDEQPFSFENSRATVNLISKDQIHTGIQSIFTVLAESTPGLTDVTISEVDANNFLETLAAETHAGVNGRHYLAKGLMQIGIAAMLDDEGYKPKPLNEHMQEIGLWGARSLLHAMRVAGSKGAAVPDVTDNDAVQFINRLLANVGTRGEDAIRKGLNSIGIASTMDDDDIQFDNRFDS
jgi:hypothetical protein